MTSFQLADFCCEGIITDGEWKMDHGGYTMIHLFALHATGKVDSVSRGIYLRLCQAIFFLFSFAP